MSRPAARPRRILLLFTKAPTPGRVMTRLAGSIGDAAAAVCQRRLIAAGVTHLARDPRWTTILAVRPGRRVRGARRWAGPVRPVAQARGALGPAMLTGLQRAGAEQVVLVGTDVPALRRRHIARAFALRGRADLVFGPATDGGYWLIGARRAALTGLRLDTVRWSSRHALADSLLCVPATRRVVLADELEDLDDLAAYRRWRAGR